MPSQVTRVPGLALLQTCRQLHDEASAFFYASNTFNCYVRKIIPAQKASAEEPQYPKIRARLNSRTLSDPLNIIDGIFFPAPRYHQHLTRLVIHLDVTIAYFSIESPGSSMPTFMNPECGNGMTRIDMEEMHHRIQDELLRVLRQIKSLWREKDVASRGRLVVPERTSWTSEMVYEIGFEIVKEK